MKDRIRRFITIMFAVMVLMSISMVANASYYDEGTDYISAMRLAAEEGDGTALIVGAILEEQRNEKIKTMNLPYEETHFFAVGRTAEEILADIVNYIAMHNKTYVGVLRVTGYDLCVRCCGKTDGVTASGEKAEVGITCAAGKKFPYGTRLYIEGIGERIVQDRGGGVHNNNIDVLCNNHDECNAITGWYKVWVIS